ncbi:cupin-like domain-containing protein [Croceibacterium ferulae]|uniref:cupin-like domain-containing protein n=1 Tax=Croceibacterium ferulae TaxID=1854641 RepID=UPI000EAF2E78|nr:cupin-like domain-containing protein [Croceibacterium ferulae]
MAEGEPAIFSALSRVPEIIVQGAAELDDRLRGADAPFVVRGLVNDWPLVQAGRRSGREARSYLLDHHRDMPFTVSIGDAQSGGRLFYDDAMGMNFRVARGKLPDILGQIDRSEDEPSPTPIYLGSINVRGYFRGLHEANHVDLGDRDATASIWIGTRTRIAAHNDQPDNLACVAAGRRRFTLFPPGQFRNLYLGPVDNTPAGRAISMVDLHAPDLDAYPRFAEAMEHAQVAELDAGDAIFIPSLWWHHVEGLAPFNVLVNYWWRNSPGWLGQPQDALNHAILALRDQPEDQKRYWREVFDHYVFGDENEATAHLPEGGRGVLAPLTPETADRLRSYLLRQLSR